MNIEAMNTIITEIAKAKKLVGQLGMRAAAGYLRNRGYSLDAALKVLLKTNVRASISCAE